MHKFIENGYGYLYFTNIFVLIKVFYNLETCFFISLALLITFQITMLLHVNMK